MKIWRLCRAIPSLVSNKLRSNLAFLLIFNAFFVGPFSRVDGFLLPGPIQNWKKKKNRGRVYYPLLFALQGPTLNTEPTQYYAPPKNQQSQRTLLQETPNAHSNTGFVGGKGNHITGSRGVNHFLPGLVHVEMVCHQKPLWFLFVTEHLQLWTKSCCYHQTKPLWNTYYINFYDFQKEM